MEMCSSHRGTRMEFSKREFFFFIKIFFMVFGLQATNRDRELICTNLAKRNDRIFEQHIQTEIYGKERRKILWRMIRLACETKLFDSKLHWIFFNCYARNII